MRVRPTIQQGWIRLLQKHGIQIDNLNPLLCQILQQRFDSHINTWLPNCRLARQTLWTHTGFRRNWHQQQGHSRPLQNLMELQDRRSRISSLTSCPGPATAGSLPYHCTQSATR